MLPSCHGSLVFNNWMHEIHFRTGKNSETTCTLTISPSGLNTVLLRMEYGVHHNRCLFFSIKVISEHSHTKEDVIVQSFHLLLFVWIHARSRSILIVGLIRAMFVHIIYGC